MINYQRIQLKFSQLIKHLLFYIPYKIWKHSLKSIDFTASVYELFDNPSYVLLYVFCATTMLFKMFNPFQDILFFKLNKGQTDKFSSLKKTIFYIIKMLSQMKLEHVFIYMLYLLCNRYYIPRYMYLFYRKKVPH